MTSLGSSLELQINHGLRLIWYTEARQEMRMGVPKSAMMFSSVRTILNPSWVRSSISPRQKVVDSGDRVE